MLLPVIKVRKFPDDGVSLKRWCASASRAKLLSRFASRDRARFQFIYQQSPGAPDGGYPARPQSVIQILSVGDLAEAIRCAVDGKVQGVFNVAPDSVVPLRSLLRITGRHGIPVPRTLQRAGVETEALDYLRIHGLFRMRESGANSALRRPQVEHCGPGGSQSRIGRPSFARAGIRRLRHGPWLDRFAEPNAVPVSGAPLLANRSCGGFAPAVRGRAVLIGTHRGFMPWDAVMALHMIVEATGRVPLFLTHPGLFKFPFVADCMTGWAA